MRLDDAARRSLGGDYLRLDDGVTHYRLDGPEDGPLILAIHGATVPAWQFDALVPPLGAAGYRTLRFDLFGHGHSDRPRAEYRLDLFVRQARQLLDAVGTGPPRAILGHSMGAAVGAALAARHPDLTRATILTAPLLDFSSTSRISRLLRPPILGEIVMRLVGRPALRRRRHRRFHAIDRPDLARRFDQQAALPGFWSALLSMQRNQAFSGHDTHYRALGQARIPALVLYGDRDQVIPPAHITRVRSLLHEPTYHELPGHEHNLLFTAPETVAAHITEFLAAN